MDESGVSGAITRPPRLGWVNVPPYDSSVNFGGIGRAVDAFKTVPDKEIGPLVQCDPSDPGCP